MQDSYQKIITDTLTYLKGLKGPIPSSFMKEELKVSPAFNPPVEEVKESAPLSSQKTEDAAPAKAAAPVSSKETKEDTKEPVATKKEEIPEVTTPLKRAKKKHPSLEIDIIAPKKAVKDPLEDVKKAIEAVMPSLYINYNVPSDEEAKRKKNSYLITEFMPEVPLLAFPHKASGFLNEIAEAINNHFFSSKLVDLSKIENEGMLDQLIKTDHLKLIIAIDTMLFSHKALMKYYQEFPARKERFLGKTPLLLLPDPIIYMQDPSLKRSLWNLLCKLLQPLKK
ncbi:MAG: hypothetical protein S4CHLAM37_03460 [Chlamydiia bacterium]|nr:hypothetical protein [Chlamydiia bacterium]